MRGGSHGGRLVDQRSDRTCRVNGVEADTATDILSREQGGCTPICEEVGNFGQETEGGDLLVERALPVEVILIYLTK